MQGAFGLGVGREPVLAVDLLVVGGEGRLKVLMALSHILRDRLSVDEDDLVILLVDPDLALEVAFSLFEGLGTGLEDVGVELVDLLAAEVLDVVLGHLLGGEHEGEAMLDLFEVCRGHQDALEGVLRSEDDALGAAALLVEGDIGDLLVLAVGPAGVLREGLDLHGLTKDVVLPGLVELAFAFAELLDDLVDGDSRGGCGVERAEALVFCGVDSSVPIWDKPEDPRAIHRYGNERRCENADGDR